MLSRTFFFVSSLLLVTPSVAQFGVAGNRRQGGTDFQKLQEKAKEQAGAGGAGDPLAALGGLGDMDFGAMQEQWGELLKDPETMKQLESMGAEMAQAMELLAQMSPEELQQQMEEAMKLLSDGSMVDSVLEKKEDVLKTLEENGAVPPEELARMKTDPAYFELKMRESFGQMQEIFGDPEYIKAAASAMGGMKEMLASPYASLAEILGPDMSDDTKIEEARLQLLSGDTSGHPMLGATMESPEIKEVVNDPVKWREAVKDGYKEIMEAMAANGGKDEL